MNKKLKIAIIGCGAIFEKNHLAAITGLPYWKISFLVDKDEALLKSYASSLQCGFSTSLDNIPADIDVCLIATPNFLHAQQSIELLNKGYHIICEKPMTISLSDAEKVKEAVEKSGKHFLIVHPKRFQKNIEYFKSNFLLTEEIKNVDISLGYKFNWESKTNFYDSPEKAGGGVFLDLGVHVIDILLSIWNKPITITKIVFGATVQTNPIIDTISTCFGTVGDVPFTIKTSRATLLNNSIRVITNKHEIELPFGNTGEVGIKENSVEHSKKINLQIGKSEDTFVPFWESAAHIIAGEKYHRPVNPTTIDEGIAAMQCIERSRTIGEFIKISK